MNETVRLYAKQLGLPTFARAEEVIRLAQQNAWGYEKFLLYLLRTESAQRKENSRQRSPLSSILFFKRHGYPFPFQRWSPFFSSFEPLARMRPRSKNPNPPC